MHDDVLAFLSIAASHSVLTAHPGKRLENNYSLNTVDICPVGALTSTDFRFKMRVWFLKETKSICTSCATGCNALIGTRQDAIYRRTPRTRTYRQSVLDVRCRRLNFGYLHPESTFSNRKPFPTGEACRHLVARLRFKGDAPAQLKELNGPQIIAPSLLSGRMTNEELWLSARLAKLTRS